MPFVSSLSPMKCKIELNRSWSFLHITKMLKAEHLHHVFAVCFLLASMTMGQQLETNFDVM